MIMRIQKHIFVDENSEISGFVNPLFDTVL